VSADGVVGAEPLNKRKRVQVLFFIYLVYMTKHRRSVKTRRLVKTHKKHRRSTYKKRSGGNVILSPARKKEIRKEAVKDIIALSEAMNEGKGRFQSIIDLYRNVEENTTTVFEDSNFKNIFHQKMNDIDAKIDMYVKSSSIKKSSRNKSSMERNRKREYEILRDKLYDRFKNY